jgi:hypothetical protein
VRRYLAEDSLVNYRSNQDRTLGLKQLIYSELTAQFQ